MPEIKSSRAAYIFLAIVLLYALKGMVYPTGVLSVGVALIELSICAYFLIKTALFKRQNTILYTLYALIGIVTVSYLISPKVVHSLMAGEFQTFTFFREFAGSVLPFFPIYYLARKGEISRQLFIAFFVSIFIASIFNYFYQEVILKIEFAERGDKITSNYAYVFVYLMPYMSLFRNRLATVVFWSVAIALSLMSAKRGTIFGVTVLLLFYIWNTLMTSKRKVSIGMLITVLLVIASYFVYDFYDSNLYLQERLRSTLEGNTSSRDYLVNSLWSAFNASSLSELLFGHGFVSTLAVAGNYAHNDWLEILFDCGLVGILAYFSFYCMLFRRMIVTKSSDKFTLIMITTALGMSSIYSMSVFNTETSYCFMLLGYILGGKRRLVI